MNITYIRIKDFQISIIWWPKFSVLSNVTPISLVYLDERITDLSSTTGGNCKVGLNWDPIISSSLLQPFNFNYETTCRKKCQITGLDARNHRPTVSGRVGRNLNPPVICVKMIFHSLLTYYVIHAAEKHTTKTGAVPEEIPVEHQKRPSKKRN